MSKQPPVPELEFLKLVRNHGQLTSSLSTIGLPTPDVLEYAKHVGTCWFQLAEEHLAEARKASSEKCARSAFSRAYYAAYNASKAVRYVSQGTVSLKGDDHGRASLDLPDRLPDAPEWSRKISILYEHRLRADYDNWVDTAKNNTLTHDDSIKIADSFIEVARQFLNREYGMAL